MKRALLLVLLILLVPVAGAQAHFTTQGYQEIVQDGQTVDYVLGLEEEALYTLADGRDKRAISAYLLPRVRVSSDGEACAGALKGWTPQRRSGEAYLRLVLQYQCASESGPFSVRYAVPNENLARFELGGQEGTFLFDPDNMVLRADDPPGFAHFIEKGVEHIVLGWDHVVFLIVLLLGARGFKDVFKLSAAFTVAHSVTLALALLGVVEIPGEIVEPLIAASIVYVAAAQVLGYQSDKQLWIVFGFGLLHGLGFAGAVTFPGGTPIVSALIGFNIGIELGQALIIGVVFPLLLWTRRYEWSKLANATAGSAAAAIGLFWLSQRVLGG
ncbi:HupE/UreJ family protein [Solirubrobacter sp. CPCC 204708]|uniref:HupE/UreJ family protein n=1 Tax=Solirubrobacter deserti TaxID=2282478 RepID=A0ABT4RU82_9ACTN|nr:HupE/UreJ family protein [Solirubrobacter deserti]MBE2316335.1 HupE/UreJ family protein [Solirubrobacter deserti]MDA0142133.1 HupE/UreJ family protein [Solirubrobacter deserti]